MATQKTSYGTNTQLTCTLNGLANNGARASVARDNTTDLALDDLIGGHFKTAAGTLAANACINLWLAPITDDMTHYAGGATGADSAFTLPANRGNLIQLGSVQINAAGTVEYFSVRSVASRFFGTLPSKYVVIPENLTGLALDAVDGGAIYYQPIYNTVA